MSAQLRDRVAALLDEAVAAYAGWPEAERLREARARLDEPLRVAIAGKVKAGKSTLLNALVGERLAPTDASECTRIVTWYTDSHTSRVTVEPKEGAPRQVPFARDGAIEVSLGELAPTAVDRLVVEWPSQWLRTMTLIDTPGIDSLSLDLSARTRAFLTPDDDQDTPADAVVYLMRHLHASDVRFLEAFHDDELAQATPINTIAVLSRADEIGVGRIDAIETAGRIAERYRRDPKVRRLYQTVVPLAGLLAEGARTLRQDEFGAFAVLAAAPEAELDELLLSADRFAGRESSAGVDAGTRASLVQRFGLFGVRVAVALLRDGTATSAPELARELAARSGLDELRKVLESQLAARRDLLKARAGLAAVDAVLRESPLPGHERLAGELERIEAGAHEFAELRLLNALRTGAVDLPDADAAERLLGAAGTEPHARLGLGPDAGDAEVRAAATATLGAWRGRAESPLASRAAAEAAGVLARTCEGLLTRVV